MTSAGLAPAPGLPAHPPPCGKIYAAPADLAALSHRTCAALELG